MAWDRIAKWFAALAGAVAGLFGEWSLLLTALVAAMGIDYASGLIVAACGRSGFIMLIVLLATLLDRAVGNQAMVFQSAATCYYIANEGLSILENAVLLGVPVPGKVRGALEELRDGAEK